jgi:hypothetical protein
MPRMAHLIRTTLIVALAVWTAGCGKKDKDGENKGEEDKGAPPAEAKGGGGDEDPNAWKPFTLEDVGVVVDAPGNAKKSGMGSGISASEGNTYCNVSIGLVDDKSQTYENLLTNAENIGGAISEMKKEKTDDNNWVVDFVGAKKSGFRHRQQLGDKVVQCGGFGKPDTVACVKKVCASLKPL